AAAPGVGDRGQISEATSLEPQSSKGILPGQLGHLEAEGQEQVHPGGSLWPPVVKEQLELPARRTDSDGMRYLGALASSSTLASLMIS
ncbi:hypothetical protein P7K49_038313, partial [Saguinus oedipus]